MDPSYPLLEAFSQGQQARDMRLYDEAWQHFTNALELSSIAKYHDPSLSCQILLERASVSMTMQRFTEAKRDIDHALTVCPQQVHKPNEAKKWLDYGDSSVNNPAVSLSCYSAALHFASEDNRLQSTIHGHRAHVYSEWGNYQECDEEIGKCRMYHAETALMIGQNWKNEGIQLFNGKKYKNSVTALQLAEKFLLSLGTDHHLNELRNQYLHDCFNFLVSATWNLQQYSSSLEAGKKCFELKANVDMKEAIRWKLKGNEILKECKYQLAVECYSLAIQYTSPHDAGLQGTLHNDRSSAYLRQKQYNKAMEDAQKCLTYLPHWPQSYCQLGSILLELQQYRQSLDVLTTGLCKTHIPDEQYEIFCKIIDVVSSHGDNPTTISFDLPPIYVNTFLKKCAVKTDWRRIELLFLGDGGQQCYAGGAGGLAANCDASQLSLSDLIKSRRQLEDLPKLLAVLIDHGALVNGIDDQPPLSTAVDQEDYASAVVLLEKQANVNGLLQSKISKSDDAPVHTAFRIGLYSGMWDIFCYLMENYKQPEDNPLDIPEVIDKKGNSLFHLIASEEKSPPHLVNAIVILKKYNIDPTTSNKGGQTPLMMLHSKKDDRYRLIEETVNSFSSPFPKNKTKARKVKRDKDFLAPDSHNAPRNSGQADENVDEPKRKHHEIAKRDLKIETDIVRIRIAMAIEELDIKVVDRNSKKIKAETIPSNSLSIEQAGKQLPIAGTRFPSRQKSNQVDIKNLPDAKDQVKERSSVLFDNLTWEVECTADVWKTLQGRRVAPDMKERIVKIIRQLANGHMRGHLAKRLEGLPKQNNILLYEAKLTRSARMLWERAIAFSYRCNNNPELLNEIKEERHGRIYSDIIRIWDIVLDHDTVPRKIESIVRSHKRCSSCIIKKQLKRFKVGSSSSSPNNDHICLPNLYSHDDDLEKQKKSVDLPRNINSNQSNEVSAMFIPPGSPEENQYHILKFYAFSNSLVNAVLEDCGETNINFPFRVSELEHAIINLKPNPMSSVLLLGRSGTGKTTCCLYRLWCSYQKYWERRTINEPGLIKSALFVQNTTENNVFHPDEKSCEADREHCKREAARGYGSRNNSPPERPIDLTASDSVTVNEEDLIFSQNTNGDNLQTTDKEPDYQHLHQAFITKNAVLCSEVQKNFQDLRQACSATRRRFECQRSASVKKLDQLEEQAWPLFLSSHDWLLMLDASLPEPAFFPRNDKGELLLKVKGWGENDNHLQMMPDEVYDYDDYQEYDVDLQPDKHEQDDRNDPQAIIGKDPRLEVTYQVFKNKLWPKMTKKRKVHYHPTLVWTEIRSFIKGSLEALHSKDGYITLDQYQILGRKKAPSFSADRESVYELFLVYQRIKHKEQMFDEADLVYDIHSRLQGIVPEWSIHEIYVDETQDFTEAELSLIIRCCRDPNRLFFTGDTAQSIMRGVAFRFNDLRSLFYYMKQSYKAVGQQAQVHVPDRVYQLVHNYRSHIGILNLASSVTDLLLHFFPESFDRLDRDQGLFHGPKPVILESYNFSDLAIILRGHKRKTSPIEFGAHQVVLVASDDVRNSLPEELGQALVMTIYEAKGLEFDDVLLYNFFKESQARKEWRVVSSYQDEDADNVVSETGIAEILKDNLQSKTRPLEFDPDDHKILISEFKNLYTALTRARVNVWLFDEDEEARAPMFEYFKRRRVVEVKQLVKTDDDKISVEGMFAEKSNKEEWRNQGHFFYRKCLWKAASKCFAMAEDKTMTLKCNAHLQAVKVENLSNEPRKHKMESLKAAELYLLCGMTDKAASYLHLVQERLLLAKLHQKCGYAPKLFSGESKFLGAGENFEKSMDYMRAVDYLLRDNRHDEALKIFMKYQILTKKGNGGPTANLPPNDQRYVSICYQVAECYWKRGQLDLMTSALETLSKTKDCITFLEKHGCVEQAVQLLLKEGKTQEAAKIMRSNGKFLEATLYTDDVKFTAHCCLLAARTALLSRKNRENAIRSEEIQELIEAPLQRAAELYNKCGDINGKAEVKFIRAKFYGNFDDLNEAGNLYYKAANYAGVAECFLLLIRKEKHPKKISHSNALRAVNGLLKLILALHKNNQENLDCTAISMCENHFGLMDTEDPHTREVPRLGARFTDLQIRKKVKNGKIDLDYAYSVIKEHLHKMTTAILQQVWDKEQCTNRQFQPCSLCLLGISCNSNCKYYHGDLTVQLFANRFYGLCFLIHVDKIVAKFLQELNRESAKVTQELRKLLEKPFRFKACQMLEELLFPQRGQLGQSYVLEESDFLHLRQDQFVCDRIIEYAKFVWHKASQEERWSDPNLFIRVSNLMHVAAAPSEEIFSLLSAEERKLERDVEGRVTDLLGFTRDEREPDRKLLSGWFERSKYELYGQCDLLKASHSAIEIFLFTSVKRRDLPNPSTANAVMSLEYYMTACLMLYSRLMMNDHHICLPANYLCLIRFWDIINRSHPNQTRLRTVIQRHTRAVETEKTRQLDRLHMETESMVKLMFGEVSDRYNIFNDTLCDRNADWDEAERVLILALTMLCNSGNGIPESCETLMRREFFWLKSCEHLPDKLRQCVIAVRESRGLRDVVNALQDLLSQKPRQESLFDVKWDEMNGKVVNRICRSESYPRNFRFQNNIFFYLWVILFIFYIFINFYHF